MPKGNRKFATQRGMKATQRERNGSVTSVAAMAAASLQWHGTLLPMQQSHDLSALMRDLQAGLVRVDATVGALDGERLAGIEDQVVKLENEV
jgi:hypothetical protein